MQEMPGVGAASPGGTAAQVEATAPPPGRTNVDHVPRAHAQHGELRPRSPTPEGSGEEPPLKRSKECGVDGSRPLGIDASAAAAVVPEGATAQNAGVDEAVLQEQLHGAIPELADVDDLLLENERLVLDIQQHQSAKRSKDLAEARKLIVRLNRNTHQVVEIYKGMKSSVAALKNPN